MSFEEWHEKQNQPYPSQQCPHYNWEKFAWNAALAAAVDAIDREVQQEHDNIDPEIGYDNAAKKGYLYAVDRMEKAINKLRD